jgi:hypothetical protein
MITDWGRVIRYNAGLFAGLKNGKLDEEICNFDDFEIKD